MTCEFFNLYGLSQPLKGRLFSGRLRGPGIWLLWRSSAQFYGDDGGAGAGVDVEVDRVSVDYFDALQLSMVRGRPFEPGDLGGDVPLADVVVHGAARSCRSITKNCFRTRIGRGRRRKPEHARDHSHNRDWSRS